MAKRRKAALLRQQHADELAKLKSKAQAQQAMMLPLIRRIRAEETKSKGLVIVKVSYNERI